MAGNNFLDAIDRGGVRPDANSFSRRTNNYNTPMGNGFQEAPRQTFKSLDGRNWSTKDQSFTANKEYYQKLYGKPKSGFNASPNKFNNQV